MSAQTAGALLRRTMEDILRQIGIHGTFRGAGLFCSLELPEGLAAAVVPAVREEGVLLGRSGNRLMFRPPLVISQVQILQVCEAIGKALANLQGT